MDCLKIQLLQMQGQEAILYHNNYKNMTQYTPSFVDVTGFTDAISQGLKEAAAMKMQQDAIVRKEIDDFKSSYDTSKLMGKDIPLFATEFDNFRTKAIEFNRLNRGGANTKDISAKQAELDAAKAKLNKIFTDSATGAAILNRLIKTSDSMANAGYAIPNEMNSDMIKLIKTPINQINFDDFNKSPNDYGFVANEKDFTQLDGVLRGIKEDKGSAVVGKTIIPVGDKKDKDYKEIELPEEEHFTIKDPYAVLGRVSDALGADARLKNAAIDKKKILINNLNSQDTDPDSLINKQLAKKIADKITKAYPELNGDINQATPAMVISATRGYLDRNSIGTSVSTKEFNAQLAAMKFDASTKAGRARYEAALKRIAGKNSTVNSSILRLILETGGAMFSDDYLKDLGLTPEIINKARQQSILYNQMKRPTGSLY